MKKIISLLLILCCFITICLTGCSGKTDNNDKNNINNEQADNNEPENKIDLSEKYWGQYFSVTITMDPGTFKLYRDPYISGKGSAKIKIIPVQPIKCYNVVFEFENLSPKQLGVYGIAITLGKVDDMIVNADGYDSCTTNITYELTDSADLRFQIALGRGEKEIKETIKNMQTKVSHGTGFNDLLKVKNVTGNLKVA